MKFENLSFLWNTYLSLPSIIMFLKMWVFFDTTSNYTIVMLWMTYLTKHMSLWVIYAFFKGGYSPTCLCHIAFFIYLLVDIWVVSILDIVLNASVDMGVKISLEDLDFVFAVLRMEPTPGKCSLTEHILWFYSMLHSVNVIADLIGLRMCSNPCKSEANPNRSWHLILLTCSFWVGFARVLLPILHHRGQPEISFICTVYLA